MSLREDVLCPGDFRKTLHLSELALVENCAVPASRHPAGDERAYQIVLPYAGLFTYNVGRRPWLMDANRTLCISPGWDFSVEHPLEGVGHAALLINPSMEVLQEICGTRGPRQESAFKLASVPSTTRLQMLTHMLLRQPAVDDPLRQDEWVIQALHELLEVPRTQSRDSRLVERAKEVLHAHSGERLSLDGVAKLVDVSPVYLTQEFSRSEGLPLYRYQMRLRLNRALLELPRSNDITGLALDLGFSSHSHFTSVFRKAFGVTPSEYRSEGFGFSSSLMRAHRFAHNLKSRRAA